jgi:hypothetical protein
MAALAPLATSPAQAATFNVKRRLGEIRCPVLVVTGKMTKRVEPGMNEEG